MGYRDWFDEDCEGRRGHPPCGKTKPMCCCSILPTLDYEIEEAERRLEAAERRLRYLLQKKEEMRL